MGKQTYGLLKCEREQNKLCAVTRRWRRIEPPCSENRPSTGPLLQLKFQIKESPNQQPKMNLSETDCVYENFTMAEKEEQKLLFGIGTDNFITLLVFGLIFTLGVLGNSMVITVLARSKPGKPRSTTNIFILNLSIADLSYLLFCIPFQSTIYMMPSWVLGAFICKFIHYFFTVSMLVSIFTLSAMSVDRYIAIVHSRKSSTIRVARHALIGVVVIWILSLAMAAPIMYYQNIFHSDNYTFCWEIWPNENHKKVYVVCTFVFGYVLPLLLISFCYAKVRTSTRHSLVMGIAGQFWVIYLFFFSSHLQVLNHLHKKLRNMSKKSEASKKKVSRMTYIFLFIMVTRSDLVKGNHTLSYIQ